MLGRVKSGSGGGQWLQKAEMVRLGIRALISRISRRQTTSVPSTAHIPIMVYSYAAPFETGKLKVSDVHSLQSVSSSSRPPTPPSPPLSFFFKCGVLDVREQLRGFRK